MEPEIFYTEATMPHCDCCRPRPHCCPGPTPEPESPAPHNKAYAQYGVSSNPASNTNLPIFEIFESGNLTSMASPSSITLKAGYVYLIDYILLATPGANSYFQIVPFINGSAGLLYSAFANSNTNQNASASASFTTVTALEQDAVLEFRLTYPASNRNIDISGAISITPVATA